MKTQYVTFLIATLSLFSIPLKSETSLAAVIEARFGTIKFSIEGKNLKDANGNNLTLNDVFTTPFLANSRKGLLFADDFDVPGKKSGNVDFMQFFLPNTDERLNGEKKDGNVEYKVGDTSMSDQFDDLVEFDDHTSKIDKVQDGTRGMAFTEAEVTGPFGFIDAVPTSGTINFILECRNCVVKDELDAGFAQLSSQISFKLENNLINLGFEFNSDEGGISGDIKETLPIPLDLFQTSQLWTLEEMIVKTTATTETVLEPTSTLSLLALASLGAASTLKRKLRPSKSTEKEATKFR